MRPSLFAANRPRLVLGPGLAIAVAAGFLLMRPDLLPDPARNRSPRLSRTRVEIPATTGSTAPDPAWVLAQRQTLSLNAAQVKRLERLRSRWDRETRPLQEALQQATARFQASMAADGDRGRMPAALQESAAPVSQLTGQLLAARRAWWGEAEQVLTASQREKAERLWETRFASGVVPPKMDRP